MSVLSLNSYWIGLDHFIDEFCSNMAACLSNSGYWCCFLCSVLQSIVLIVVEAEGCLC